MRLIRLVVGVVALAVASTVLVDDASAQQQSSKIRASVTVVSGLVAPAATDSLVAAAVSSDPGRLVLKGVRVVVKEPSASVTGQPAPSPVAHRTRKVEIHYVGV